MSTPDVGYQHIKYLDFGFLAVKAERAALALAQSRELNEEDRSALVSGSKFLSQVAAGAQALTTGDYQVQNLNRAIEAFELAVDPLEQIGDLLSNNDVAKILNSAADQIASRVSAHRTDIPNESELQAIQLFAKFFGSFYRVACSHIEQTSVAPILGEPRSTEPAGVI